MFKAATLDKPASALLGSSAEANAHLMRLALSFAMSTTVVEYAKLTFKHFDLFGNLGIACLVLMSVAVVLTLSEKYSRAGVLLYFASFAPIFLQFWMMIANHNWLSYWCIPAAALFVRWWEEEAYSDYLRITLGVVMLAAAVQKLVAGTYLDGTYIAYLSHYGSTTEKLFAPLCSEDTLNNPCLIHQIFGIFIVVWQIVVGILLVAGFKALIFLVIEIGFLLAAGVYADEMNFQALNIALLCIAFRVGLSYQLLILLIAFLITDWFKIGGIIAKVI